MPTPPPHAAASQAATVTAHSAQEFWRAKLARASSHSRTGGSRVTGLSHAGHEAAHEHTCSRVLVGDCPPRGRLSLPPQLCPPECRPRGGQS